MLSPLPRHIINRAIHILEENEPEYFFTEKGLNYPVSTVDKYKRALFQIANMELKHAEQKLDDEAKLKAIYTQESEPRLAYMLMRIYLHNAHDACADAFLPLLILRRRHIQPTDSDKPLSILERILRDGGAAIADRKDLKKEKLHREFLFSTNSIEGFTLDKMKALEKSLKKYDKEI